MRRRIVFLPLLCGALLMPTVLAAAANGAIIVRGNKMYNEQTGERFIMKGLTYEYAVSDDLYTKYSKNAIATSLNGFDFNTVRVYNINPDESYKLFMTDMAKRGVYVLVAASPDNNPYFGKYRYAPMRKDLGPNGKVTTKDGVTTTDVSETCYPALLLEYGKKIAKNFAQYDNTLGIILANEIMQMDLTAAACVKQYGADLKSWMRQNVKNMRTLPLAYAAADSSYASSSPPLIPEVYHVIKIQGLLCGDQMKDGMMTKSIDIYLINEYRWGNEATYSATYAKFLAMVQGLPIVIGFGEFGNADIQPRTWPMVPYLLEEPNRTQGFSNVFSGGLAYSFGEAKLDANAKFPMFTGGSRNFDETPSFKQTTDYVNLKAQYDKYQPYSDPAAWTTDSKCTWAPTIQDKIDASNTLATKSGWILDNCDDPSLILAKTDTWITKTRDGMVCDDQGGVCQVSVTSRVGTTQQDICGGEIKIESGGGKCKVDTDCGTHGKCATVNGVNECSCQSCYTGLSCDIKDTACSTKLSNSKNAPKYVLVGLGVLAVIALVAFIILAIVAQRKKSARNKLAARIMLQGSRNRQAM